MILRSCHRLVISSQWARMINRIAIRLISSQWARMINRIAIRLISPNGLERLIASDFSAQKPKNDEAFCSIIIEMRL